MAQPQPKNVLFGYKEGGLRSKSWDEFLEPESSTMDHVITFCGNAAGEDSPLRPDKPATAHWDIAAAVHGESSEKREAFARTYRMLEGRIQSLVNQSSRNSQ